MACLLLVALACTSESADEHDADEHTTPVEAPTDTVFEQTFPLGAGQVAEVGLPPLTLHEDVSLESVTIGTASGTAELLATGLSYEPVAAGCWNAGGSFPGRDVAPVAGAVLKRGERPYLILYVRPQGDAVVDQVVVRYAHEGEHIELRWNAVRLDFKVGTPGRCRGG